MGLWFMDYININVLNKLIFKSMWLFFCLLYVYGLRLFTINVFLSELESPTEASKLKLPMLSCF